MITISAITSRVQSVTTHRHTLTLVTTAPRTIFITIMSRASSVVFTCVIKAEHLSIIAIFANFVGVGNTAAVSAAHVTLRAAAFVGVCEACPIVVVTIMASAAFHPSEDASVFVISRTGSDLTDASTVGRAFVEKCPLIAVVAILAHLTRVWKHEVVLRTIFALWDLLVNATWGTRFRLWERTYGAVSLALSIYTNFIYAKWRRIADVDVRIWNTLACTASFARTAFHIATQSRLANDTGKSHWTFTSESAS